MNYKVCVLRTNLIHLSEFQVNTVTDIEVIRQNEFSHAKIENTRWVSFDIKFTRQGFENAC